MKSLRKMMFASLVIGIVSGCACRECLQAPDDQADKMLGVSQTEETHAAAGEVTDMAQQKMEEQQQALERQITQNEF